ncbi:MAG: hypothetical protein HFH08_05415 [Bacilli bacterium]|nr:hypothetical protein [Bacilli bacterium]
MKLEDVAQAYKKEGIEIGKKQGEERGVMKTTLSMLQEGLDLSLIERITGLSEKEILNLQNNSSSLL